MHAPHAKFRYTTLERCDLTGSDFRWADFRGANLSYANLSGADLRWADLRGANLSYANLSGACLRWADFRGADLRGTILTTDSLNLHCTDFRLVLWHEDTVWPETLAWTTRPWGGVNGD